MAAPFEAPHFSGEQAFDFALERLAAAPGVDPVIAAHQNMLRRERLPASGYLISARVTPGIPEAEFDIALYGDGCLLVKPDRDERPDGGALYARATIIGPASISAVSTPKFESNRFYHPVYYPPYPGKPGTTPKFFDLAGDAKLMVRKKPHVLGPHGQTIPELRSYNLQTNPDLLSTAAGDRRQLEIQRAVWSPTEAALVCRSVGEAMGMVGGDLEHFVGHMAGLDVIAALELAPPEPQTRSALEMAITGLAGILPINRR
ncbi:MAG TPA: hypothetical protein VLG47_02075 [Candidatus Saccharimonadales bacterium]|nr:hypothetical protein [Candidatus Saccharimonadales bacterium]